MPSTADPRILLKYQFEMAVNDTTDAIVAQHRSTRLAKAVARGRHVNYLNVFAALSGLRAVELYRTSADRKEEKELHRRSQRTSARRQAKALTRAARRPNEWDGSPLIPAENASALSVDHARVWFALMLLGFFFTEERKPFGWISLKHFETALVALYCKPTNVARIKETLGKTMRRHLARSAPQPLYHFHNVEPASVASNELLAIKVFTHWRQIVVSQLSGRPKSRPLRRAS